MNTDMPIATDIHTAIYANTDVHTSGVSESDRECSSESLYCLSMQTPDTESLEFGGFWFVLILFFCLFRLLLLVCIAF